MRKRLFYAQAVLNFPGAHQSGLVCLSLLLLFFVGANASTDTRENAVPKFQKNILEEKFYSEGAYYADINRDGSLDMIAGPFWFEGPDYKVRHEYAESKAIELESYSEFFFNFAGDFNGDGWVDILTVAFPGAAAHWYENPQGKAGHWKKTLAIAKVDNESPDLVDMDGDGQVDLIYTQGGLAGFASYDTKMPYETWKFRPVSSPEDKLRRTGHGIGYGDINGDGKLDMIVSEGWFEAPATNDNPAATWKFHRFDFADAAAQLLVFDIDGDGKSDVVTSWHCHHYGLLWYRQVQDADGQIAWEKHEIIPVEPNLDSGDLRITQMHAFDKADFNGDGRMDFVTGKRRWAHGSKGDSEPKAPFVLYWFENAKNGNGQTFFRPHLIDGHSGVGTQVVAADMNGDNRPDVMTGNKNGIFVFTNQP